MRDLLILLSAMPALLAADLIAVAHKHGDSVGFYETGTGRALATLPVGVRPHEMALSADGRSLYVTNYGIDRWTDTAPGGNTISVIDVTVPRVTATIQLGRFRRPHGIERGRSGKLYVTVDEPPSVVVVDPQVRKVVRDLPVRQAAPHMVAVSEDESRIYTANSGSATVTVLPEGKHIPIGGIPMGLALSADGKRLWAANRTGNEVVLIDTARNEVIHRIDISGHPVRVRLTPDERSLLVTMIEAGDYAVINTSSLQLFHRNHAGTHLEGIQMDAAGRYAYVAAQGDQRVIRIDMSRWRIVDEIATGPRPDPIIVLPAAVAAGWKTGR